MLDPKYYSGIDPDGKLQLTPWFTRALAAAGCPPIDLTQRGRAMDSFDGDSDWLKKENADRDERYRLLEAEYAKCLGSPMGLSAEGNRLLLHSGELVDMEGAVAATRRRGNCGTDDELTRFKRGRGMDHESAETVALYYELERLYAQCRGEDVQGGN